MPYTRTTDGLRLYYEAHGEGTPLVLAYGVGGNADMWDTNTPELARHHRVILWEPRGHARSDSPEDTARYSLRRWALDLRDVLDQLGIRRAHVGGLSLGGGIATRFTLLYPKRVLSLIVTNSSSATGVPMSRDSIAMRATSIALALTKGMDAVAEYLMNANANLTVRVALDPGAKAEFYEEYRRLDPIGYVNSLIALLARDPIASELPSIRVPTLLIGGDRDPSLGPMRVLHRRIRGSKLVVLSPASHFANRDQPGAWNRAVLEFLRAHDQTGRRRADAARPSKARGDHHAGP